MIPLKSSLSKPHSNLKQPALTKLMITNMLPIHLHPRPQLHHLSNPTLYTPTHSTSPLTHLPIIFLLSMQLSIQLSQLSMGWLLAKKELFLGLGQLELLTHDGVDHGLEEGGHWGKSGQSWAPFFEF